MKNISKFYVINVKNKSLGKISNFIIKIIKFEKIINKNKKNKIIILNYNLIKFYKKKYKKIFHYKYTGFMSGLKKKSFLKINKKELIKNSLLGMIKNNKTKKYIKKKVKFLKEKKFLKKIKNKILYF